MPKTAKTRPPFARHIPLSPAASLTTNELKELITLIESIESSYASFEPLGRSPGDKRYLAKLERIKGKLRRGF